MQVVKPGQEGAQLSVPWQKPVSAVGQQGVTLVAWPGMVVQAYVQSEVSGHVVKSGARVGTLMLQAGNTSFHVPLQASQGIQAPSLKWRLERLPAFLRHL